jgi:hypothetical protein
MAGFEDDGFYIEQLIRPLVNLYRISSLAPGGTAGEPLAFVRQKRMALREDIRFFRDENEHEELFRIKARQVLEVGGRYDVVDAGSAPIGVLHKEFGRSLLRSSWRLLGPGDEEQGRAQETSMAVAVLRRVIDYVPYVGEFIPIPYNFEFLVGAERVGTFNRIFGFRDRYVLDLSGDTQRRIDRRLAVALGIALDAVQNR